MEQLEALQRTLVTREEEKRTLEKQLALVRLKGEQQATELSAQVEAAEAAAAAAAARLGDTEANAFSVFRDDRKALEAKVAAAEEKAKAAVAAVAGSAAAEQTAKLEEMKRALARAVKRNKTEKDAAAQREASLVEQLEAVKAAGGAAEEAQARLEEHAREASEAAAEREALLARVEAAELTAEVAVRPFPTECRPLV